MKNIIVLLALLTSACSTVAPGERGVQVTLGKVGNDTLTEGYYFYIPFVKYVKTLSIQVQKTETETEAATKDMQKVTSTIAVNWHLDPMNVNKVFQTIGDEHALVTQIINPAVSEVLKASTAKLTAEEVLTKRIELKNTIDAMLKDRLKIYNLFVDDISLVNLNFTAEFNHAVEQKQIAEQDAKRAEYVAQRAIKEADAEVNRAKGQAEAQRLLKSTMTAEILQQRAIEKWNGVMPQIMGQGTLPFINVKTQ